MLLPLIQTTLKELSLLQTRWKALLDPVLKNPLNEVSILKNVTITAGITTQVPHLLGRVPNGWFVVNVNTPNVIYNSKPFDSNFLYLACVADDTISLGVF